MRAAETSVGAGGLNVTVAAAVVAAGLAAGVPFGAVVADEMTVKLSTTEVV